MWPDLLRPRHCFLLLLKIVMELQTSQAVLVYSIVDVRPIGSAVVLATTRYLGSVLRIAFVQLYRRRSWYILYILHGTLYYCS